MGTIESLVYVLYCVNGVFRSRWNAFTPLSIDLSRTNNTKGGEFIFVGGFDSLCVKIVVLHYYKVPLRKESLANCLTNCAADYDVVPSHIFQPPPF